MRMMPRSAALPVTPTLLPPPPPCLPCRSLNPYVANSFGNWAVPHRLPIQSAPASPANAGTSSFGMSGVNAHAILAPPAAVGAAAAAPAAPLAWQRGLRCLVEALVPLHPLLATAVKAKQSLAFRLPLSRPALAFLWDHKVQGAPIMPGAAYLEMAAAAGRTLLRLPEPAVALTAAAIAAPLRLPSTKHADSVVVSAEVVLATGEISIRSGPAGSRGAAKGSKAAGSKVAPETLHLRGTLVSVAAAVVAALQPVAARALSADAVRAACQEPRDTAAVYKGLHGAGLQYGPVFRRLRGIQQGDGSAAAALTGGDSVQHQSDADVSGFLLHPAMLDSCLQLGALVQEPAADGASPAEAGAFVPAGLAAYLVQLPLQQGRGVHAVVRRSPEAARRAAGATYRDHTLQSASGAVLAALDGLEAKQLHAAGSRPPAGAKQAAEVVYEVAWQAAARAELAAERPSVSALALSLPGSSAMPLAAASAGLLALQGALQQRAAAVHLRTQDDMPAGLAGSGAAPSGNALWGMLRSFAAEAPAVSHGGVRFDAATPAAAAAGGALVLAGSTGGSSPSDFYGSRVRAGAAMHAALLPSSRVRAAAGPYHLMPKPRGAFR